MALSCLLMSCLFALLLPAACRSEKQLFSTETGYDLSFDRPRLNDRVLAWKDLARRTASEAPEGINACTLLGSYTVYREGTSFPPEEDIRLLNAVQRRLRTQTINPAYQFLTQISNGRLPLANAGDLAEYGRREMQELASRVKTRFPEFFTGKDVDLSRFGFASTNSSESVESAVAFARGLVGLNQICETVIGDGNVTVTCSENSRLGPVVTPTSAYIPHETTESDPILLPAESRQRCLTAANKGRTERELRNFKRGQQVARLRDRISRKLARPGAQPWNISNDEVQVLAKMCGYHLAMFSDNNTWCRLFEFEDLNVAEYERELAHYWDSSYGVPLNSRVACPLINDTFSFFKTLTAAGAGAAAGVPPMNFKFTNADTLLRLISLLGIAEDPMPLNAASYSRSRNRQFRTGRLAPFAGNVALNLYRCQESSVTFFSDPTYRVQVLLNELPVNITFCQDSFCDLEDFQRELMARSGQCEVQRDCDRARGIIPRGNWPGGAGSGAAALGAPTAGVLVGTLLSILAAVFGHKVGL